MEVARSGVFYPGQFSFQEIMMLFLGMMLGNILLLDLYNTLGLPTSTTVSMVFGLLGAGVAAALFHIWGDAGASIADLSQYINTGKAMAIIAAILLSVALAFAAGSLFMYVSRLIFSFRFAPVFRRWGAVWCGISLAGILYFALFKGLKSSGLIPTSVADYVGEHVLVTLLAFWAASSVVLWLFQRMRLNIMRITILSGTFALALAFAGNDLVNFIGVPLGQLRRMADRPRGRQRVDHDGRTGRTGTRQFPAAAGIGAGDGADTVLLEEIAACHRDRAVARLAARG